MADQSSFSSGPGSAIEGIGQKIPLNDELAALGMQLPHLGFPADLRVGSLVINRLVQVLDGLSFPQRNRVRVVS